MILGGCDSPDWLSDHFWGLFGLSSTIERPTMGPCANAESPPLFSPFRLDINRQQRDDRFTLCRQLASWSPIAGDEGKQVAGRVREEASMRAKLWLGHVE